ncbi:TonB-dependent siderophore receptor [Aquabacterium sp.]|uniref:TonB-dependent siderophore receptor n=1 Tax=Aquabacterium sp. TaxID=1872578 RepID=UPI002C19EE71|nr:TonB-dependent siderophore receptor [Aquabacterium sp.]HSW03501.1 TonB-dependent siderophore receptor [Aquabacterium sp.]
MKNRLGALLFWLLFAGAVTLVWVAIPVQAAAPGDGAPSPGLPASSAAATGETTLPVVRVKAAADKETATSPVTGYAARRSATATKTDTPLNEVPQSITVITADQIKDQNAQTMQDVLRYTAGVRAEMYGLDNRGDWFSLRGGSEGSTLLDGLRLPLSGWWGVMRNEPFAFERIEVLRGPASVVAGQNGPGGVVNLVSKRPQAEALHDVELQFGSHGHKQLAADLTGPLNLDGSLRYRLVALGKDSNTQVDHAYDERSFVAPSLTWQPVPGTTLTVFAEYQKDRSGNTNAFLGYQGTLLPAPHGPISPSLFIGEPDWDWYGGERKRFGWRLEQQLGEHWTLRHSLRRDRITGGMRSMYAAWWDGFVDAGGNPDPNGTHMNRLWYGTDNQARIGNADLLLEGRLTLGSTRHTVLMGVDTMTNRNAQGYWNDGDATPLDVYHPVYGGFADPMAGTAPDVLDSSHVRNTGLLLQDQVKFGDRFVLVAGLRHDRARTGDVRDSATSKNLGAVWLADPGWSPYASYSESFDPTAGSDADGHLFKPKRGKQIEAGLKWSPADRPINASAAVYRLKELNRLAPDPVRVGFSVQRGEVSVKGLELEMAAHLRAWDLVGHYSYTDAVVSRTTADDVRYLGAQLAGIPKHQAALWALHRFGAYGLPGLKAGLGVRHVARTGDGTDSVFVPSYTLVDALLAYEHQAWRVALNVTNLANKTYLASCLERGDCWFGSQRRAVVSVAYRW